MADGVHAAIDAMQPAARYAPPNRVGVKPRAGQLGQRDNAVLAPRERGKRRVRGGGSYAGVAICATFSLHPPEFGARVVTDLHRSVTDLCQLCSAVAVFAAR